MGKFMTDFKEFAMKGNVIDMAVGVVIGGAFGKIVTSLVNDIIMPAVGVLTGGMDFKEFKYVLQEAVMNGEEVVSPEVTINYGMFIQYIVDFLIIAFCIFMVIRMMAKLKRKKEEEPAPAPEPPAPSNEEVLLTEIRDLLRDKK